MSSKEASKDPEDLSAPESELDPLVGRSSGETLTSLLPHRGHLNGDPPSSGGQRSPNEEDPARLQALVGERQPLLSEAGPDAEMVLGHFEEEGDWVQLITGDCPSVVSSDDVRGEDRRHELTSRRNDGVSSDVKAPPDDGASPEAHRPEGSTAGDVNSRRSDAASNDVRNRQNHRVHGAVKHRHGDGLFSDAGTGARCPGTIVRSSTDDACVGTLGTREAGNVDHLATHSCDKAVRRLSSGDAPYWLQTAEDGTSDPHNMTLFVPGPSKTEEGYLIGRASPRGDVALVRMTRLTEVAPTNSSIVDDEDQWKMPLQVFTSKKQGAGIAHFKSKRIRSYYKAQDTLISAYEDISLRVNDDLLDTDFIKKQRKLATFYSKVTLAVNVVLLVGKLVASILSGSISIISSLVDSVVDLLSGVIMWWATRAVKTRDPYTYPQGRTKLEPVAIIILSVVMGLASLQLVRESVEKVVTLAADPSSLPRVEAPVFAIAGSTVVIKLVLWLVCRRVRRSSIVQALALDHRNDVLSNTVAMVCGYLGSREFQKEFGIQGFIYVDPAGAILISLYIVINWWQTGSEQIKMLTGHTARPDFLSKLTWTAMNHDQSIRHIDTVRAFHFGNNFLVELDIVLPEDMSLRVAHDIGESLQQKLENIPEVERAFVHLDYEYLHNPNSEHKVV